MQRLYFLIGLFLIFNGQLNAQTEIQPDGTLDCPYFRAPVLTGGIYQPGCPANCYVYIPHLYYFEDNYEYSIDGGAHWQKSPYFGNLVPGSYNISMRLTIGGHSCTKDYPLNPVYVTYRDFSTQIYHSDTDSLERSGKSIIENVLITRPANCALKGTVEVKLTLGGGGSYEYSLDGQNFQVSRYFYNVAVGKYSLFVREIGANCRVAYRYGINVTPLGFPDYLGQIVNWSCDDGEIRMIVSDSSGCSFSLDGSNWQSSGLYSDLSPGHYFPKVKKNNCIMEPADNEFAGISTFTPQVFDLSFTPGPCDGNGSINGKIYVPYLKKVDGGIDLEMSTNGSNYTHLNPQNLPDFSYNIPVNTTRIYIRVNLEPSDCIYYFDIDPTTGTLTSPVITKTNPSCLLSNGQISLTPQDNGSYEYSINNGSSYQSSPDFNALPPGTYHATYRNPAHTCFSDTVTVTLVNENIPPIINSVTKNNVSDCGVTDGKITINATPGTGSILYSIDNGLQWQSSNSFTGLDAGSYTIKIRNNNSSCEVVYTNNPVVITKPTPPAFNTVTHTNVTNCGLTDGSIMISANQGSSALEYSINNGSTWQSSGTFTGLNGGNYLVAIRNNNGTCKIDYPSNPVVISKPSPPTFNSVTHTNVTNCGLTDGSITISANPGSAALEYSINNGSTWQSSGTFTGLDGGSYPVAIRNNNGTCKIDYPSNPVVISKPLAPVFSDVTSTNTTDCGINDASITITATPGSAAIRYSIDNGTSWQTSGQYINLAPANYTTKIKNADNTCIVDYPSNPVIIPGHTAPVINDVSSTDVSDCGLSDGGIEIDATGSEGSILYSIDNGSTWSSSSTFTSLDGGEYNAKIKNNNGTCIVTFTFNPIEINEPVAPQISAVSTTNVSDCGLSDGKIIVTAFPGSSTLQYSIDGGSQWQSSNTFPGLSADNYTVSVRNDNATCLIDYINNPVEITTPIAPVINSVQSTNVSDCDAADGTITIQATPGSSGIQYSIDNGTNWQSTPTFTSLPHGSYFIKVRNDNATCNVAYVNNPVIIAAPEAPQITGLNVSQPTTCINPIGTIIILYENGSGSSEFSVDGGATWQQSNTFSNLPPGTYYPGIRNTDGSCESVNSSPVVLNALAWPQIISVETQGLIGCGGQTATILITADGSDLLGLQYSIDNGVQWQSSSQFNGLGIGDYFIKVKYETNVCEVTYTSNPVSLTQVLNPVISGVISTDPVSCTDQQTGSIQILANDPTGLDMKFSINNGSNWQSNSIFSSLAPGIYLIKVKNNLDCITEYNQNPVQLKAPSQPIVTGVSDLIQPDCDKANGSFTIQYSQSQTVQFSIDNGGHWSDNPHFTGLSAENYYLKIRNADGNCENAYLYNPYRLNEMIGFEIAQVIVTDPSDCGLKDGKVEINVIPTDQYEFSLDGGVHWQTSSEFTDLAEGKYRLKVRLKNSDCVLDYTQEIQLKPATAPVINSVKVVQPGCGKQDGKITIVVNGTEVEYSIDSGVHWQATNVFSGLDIGTYYAATRFKDAHCIAYASDPILLKNQKTFDILKVTTNDNTDCQQANGSITIEVNKPGLLFSIDTGAHWQISNVFGGLSAGLYSIQVRDTSSKCTLDYPSPVRILSIGGPQIRHVDYIPTENCSGQEANISISAPEAELFSIDGGIHWSVDSVFTQLDTGKYLIAVKKANCVTLGQTLHFTSFKKILLTQVQEIQPSDCTLSDGALTILASPVENIAGYSIDGGLNFTNNPVFDSLTSGEYHPVVKNSDGCLFSFPDVRLYANADQYIQSLETIASTDCVHPEGSLIIHLFNPVDWQFSLDSGRHWQQDTIFNNLQAGRYQLLMQLTGDSCIFAPTQEILITGKNIPHFTGLEINYPGDCTNGNAELTIISSGANYLFSIDGGAHWQTNPLFTSLEDRYYIVSILDTLSQCRSNDTTIGIWASAPELDGLILSNSLSDCALQDGSIVIKNPSGQALRYSIEAGMHWQVDSVFSNLSPGSYLVIAESISNGCRSLPQEVRLGWPGFEPYAIKVKTRDPFCGDNGTITGESPLPQLTYSINNGAIWQDTLHFLHLATGEYSVEIKDNSGCTYQPGIPVYLALSDSLPYEIKALQSPTCKEMNDGLIAIIIPPDLTDQVTITWPDGSHSNSFSGVTGTYTVELRLDNCTSTSKITIPESTQDNFAWRDIHDTTLCAGSQVLYWYTDTTYAYQWAQHNCSSNSNAFWAGAGDVTLTVSDTAGCTRLDQWTVSVSDEEKDLDILLPVEGLVGMPVTAIDISDPKPDSIRWTLDDAYLTASQIIENQLHFIYADPGIYTITADIWSGDCHVTIQKQCTIYSTKDSLQFPQTNNHLNVLANMMVYPSPNTGTFKLSMEYNQLLPGKIFIYNSEGNRVYSQEVNPQFNFELLPIDIHDPQSGIYSIVYRAVTGEIHWRNFIIIK
jgi:hypothetical protein